MFFCVRHLFLIQALKYLSDAFLGDLAIWFLRYIPSVNGVDGLLDRCGVGRERVHCFVAAVITNYLVTTRPVCIRRWYWRRKHHIWFDAVGDDASVLLHSGGGSGESCLTVL